MTFLDHGIETAMLASVGPMLARARVRILAVAIVVGFLFGITPDVAGFVVGALYPNDPRVSQFEIVPGVTLAARWDIYGELHTGPVWQYVFFMHTIVDAPFHAAGTNWWPREWQKAVIHWVAELVGIAGIVWYIKQKKRGAI